MRRAAEEKQRAEDEEAAKWMNMISVEDTVRCALMHTWLSVKLCCWPLAVSEYASMCVQLLGGPVIANARFGSRAKAGSNNRRVHMGRVHWLCCTDALLLPFVVSGYT